MKIPFLFIAFLFGIISLTAQEDEDYVPNDKPQNTLQFKKIDTKYIGNEAWRSWYWSTSADRLQLYMPYSGKDGWREWRLEGGNFDALIRTTYSNKDAWMEWSWRGKEKISIRTVYRSKDAWKEWEISLENSTDRPLVMRPRYRSSEKAWTEWDLENGKGERILTIQTRYSGGKDLWQTWEIRDEAPNLNPELKAAAIFTALFSAIMPYCNPVGACAFNGIPLQGKVKYVDYGEDLKIKYVEYGEDLKVQEVQFSATECGKWQKVDYGEDFKVKVVQHGEDLKVKKVQFSPGMSNQ